MVEWITQNWVWILVAVAFVGMHMFGHAGIVFCPVYNWLRRRYGASA